MSVDSNNDDSDDTTTTTIVGAIVIVLAVIAVAMRFYTRYFTRAGFSWDDWLVLLALIATILSAVLVLWCLYPWFAMTQATSVDPTGPSAASNTDPNYEYTADDVFYTKLNYAATVLYFTITSATKLSILFMYYRLFSVSPAFRIQGLFLGVLVVAFWIGCTVANLLNCRPLEWTWRNSLDDPRYCFNYNFFWMASGSVEAFIDVLIIAMPIRMIFVLHLNTAKKVALSAVFMLGIFVIVTGLVKVILSYVPGNREPDFNQTEVWGTVHLCIGIVCACLPVCWPLFVRTARFLRGQWHTISGWSFIQTCSKRRSTTMDLERATMSNTGDILLMDDRSRNN